MDKHGDMNAEEKLVFREKINAFEALLSFVMLSELIFRNSSKNVKMSFGHIFPIKTLLHPFNFTMGKSSQSILLSYTSNIEESLVFFPCLIKMIY